MSTSNPPLIFLVTLPETGSFSFLDFMIASQLMMRSALRLLIFHQTGVALDVFEEDADLVADLHGGRIVELGMFEDAFGLQAQLDDEVVAGLGADLALDDVAGDQVLDIFTGDELGGVLLASSPIAVATIKSASASMSPRELMRLKLTIETVGGEGGRET